MKCENIQDVTFKLNKLTGFFNEIESRVLTNNIASDALCVFAFACKVP